MKTTRTLLCLTSTFLFFLSFQAFYPAPIPDNKEKELLDKANQFNQKFPQENVYLHLDRPSYWSNDDIWFKAYLKDSPIPDCNLYVELLNSSGTILQKKMYWAQNGLAYGDFHLKDTISTGIYQIRAYTNWMRNFDDFWFYRKDLVIWNLNNKVIRHESRSLKENDIDFQFFPEGGTFITNLQNKVAFKATDQNGKGLDVEGIVVDDQGQKVAKFKSQFKGIGSFMLKPQQNRKYIAQVKIAGITDINADLPVPQMTGVNLSLDPCDSILIHARISSLSIPTIDNRNAEFLLVGLANGVVSYKIPAQLKNGVCNLDIWKDALPTGIVQFTLFDKDMIPCCERLVFVNRNNHIDVEIEPDKKNYLTRQEVQIKIKAFTKSRVPCLSNLSMSVYNQDNPLKIENYPNNILTHFLLNSELKGLIEDPAYYFKDDSLSTLHALDNLMLTHGYRYFEWKEINEDRIPKITFPAEECIKVKGIVKSSLLQKPIPKCKISMASVKGLFRFYQQETDSVGQFLFSNLYFNDTIQFSLQTINKKGKRNTMIELDKRSFISPQRSFLPVTYKYSSNDPGNKESYLNEVNNDFLKRKWHLSDTIMLNEVRVAKPKYKFGERPMRLYDKADYNLDLDTDDDELGNVFHKLEDKIPNILVRVFDEGGSGMGGYRNWDVLHLNENARVSVKIDYNPKGPVYVLDGSVVDEALINAIPAGAFKRVEILKNGAVYGNFQGGAVCFFTKYGAFHAMPNEAGTKSTRVIGYSKIRKFYSPNYETQQTDEIKDDFRNTLYWNPIVKTDSTGVANVAFYNSDQTGEVQVVVEGITADGKLCRGLCRYTVTK